MRADKNYQKNTLHATQYSYMTYMIKNIFLSASEGLNIEKNVKFSIMNIEGGDHDNDQRESQESYHGCVSMPFLL
jgi:hypothetical protein